MVNKPSKADKKIAYDSKRGLRGDSVVLMGKNTRHILSAALIDAHRSVDEIFEDIKSIFSKLKLGI